MCEDGRGIGVVFKTSRRVSSGGGGGGVGVHRMMQSFIFEGESGLSALNSCRMSSSCSVESCVRGSCSVGGCVLIERHGHIRIGVVREVGNVGVSCIRHCVFLHGIDLSRIFAFFRALARSPAQEPEALVIHLIR